ncbi:MAG TPA: hypothetical protein VKX25_08865 [Bryobacteraceae bacterium]|jgi:hypothetical protein|nr:hypothetical protein [Bryobacteraceae bacterium]
MGVLQAGPIDLAPGSLLLSQPTIAITTANTITYSQSGKILSTGQITGTGDLAEAMTVLSGQLYVSDGSGAINRIDLSSGAVSSSFSTGMIGLDGLGSLGTNLIAVDFQSTAIAVYTPGGQFLNSITLASVPSGLLDWTGLASDGSLFYIGDYGSGRIYRYDMTGRLVGYIDTGLTNSLLSLSYDAANKSLWVTSGAAVLDYSLNGTVLSQFATGSFRGSSIAVVPGSSVPEPDSRAVVAIVLAIAVLKPIRRLLSANMIEASSSRGCVN